MKASEILRRTAKNLERSKEWGFYTAPHPSYWERVSKYLDEIALSRGAGDSPGDWPLDIRIIGLCLAAAIAESEGD